jgi:hypothetical protein
MALIIGKGNVKKAINKRVFFRKITLMHNICVKETGLFLGRRELKGGF